jgi:hypothetical protein
VLTLGGGGGGGGGGGVGLLGINFFAILAYCFMYKLCIYLCINAGTLLDDRDSSNYKIYHIFIYLVSI